jgi:hypothetical protein
MTITAVVTISEGEHSQQLSYTASDAGQEAVRFKFNPSAFPAVTRIKALTSLLVSEINTLKAITPAIDHPSDLSAQEIFNHARQLAVDASMNAVLGATKGL